jgi:putative transposase
MGGSLKRSLGMAQADEVVCPRSTLYNPVMLIGKRYTKRSGRHNIPGHAHELTFSCYDNRAFLLQKRFCGYLVDSIVSSRQKHQFDLWAYVFMPNHVHLLICPREPEYSVSNILLSIKQPVARKATNYLRNDDPDGLKALATSQAHRPYRFWQKGGGYDRNITKMHTMIELVRYIYNNPVRKGLVETPEQWHYSSAADWESARQGPIPIDFDSFPS